MVDSNLLQNISVLLVEDDAASRQLVKRALHAHDPSITYEISEAEDLASARRMLGERNFDNVILDLRLPDSSGLDTLHSIKEADPDVPVVVLSGISDHETAVNSIRYGADYYIVKGDMLREMLGRSICFSIERRRRKLETENQGNLQNHVDLLHYQIREIKESLTDQISSKNHTERTMQQLTTEHEQLLDILPAMIWHLDKNGKIIRLNKPAADLIGKNANDVIGKDFYRLFAGNDDHARMKHELVLRDGIGFDENIEAYKSTTGSLEYRRTEVVPDRDEFGNVSGLVILARNPIPKNIMAKTSALVDRGKSLKEKFSSEKSFTPRQTGAVRVEKPDKTQKQYSGRVLIVDHDSLNRMLIGTHLKGSGLDVDFAVNGLEAIEKSQLVNFDMVLTALLMPELDGLEVAYKLRQDEYKSPVIIMTTDYSKETIKNIKKSGCTDYIFKPINKKDLFAAIDKHLVVPAVAE
ncbi:MAG: response regulator [Planctomycetes bacterium]|nr:response regulator [Planctomycetota bacterium]